MQMHDDTLPPPRANPHLYGYDDAQRLFHTLWKKDALPHAWLIAGPRGIGKATLAWRIARFLLVRGRSAAAEESGPGLFGDDLLPATDAESPEDPLAVDMAHPACQRILAGSHADLVSLEHDPGADKNIKVDQVRAIRDRLQHTSAEGGWRVVLIDPAEAMNANAANALLKMLEEPPPRTLLLLISHAPGRLLPTIRSRCRMLRLPPMSDDRCRTVLDRLLPDVDAADRTWLSEAVRQAPGLAAQLHMHGALELRDTLHSLLARPSSGDIVAFCEKYAAKAMLPQWDTLTYLLQHTLEHRIRETALTHPAAAKPFMELRDTLILLFTDVARIHIDRKQALFTVLHQWRRSSEAATGA